MKKKQFIFLILMLSSVSLYTQNNALLNAQGLTLDSINNIVSDKNISLHFKYEVVNSITNYREYKKILPLYQSVLAEAKKQKVDSVQMQMYNRLMITNFTNMHFEEAKVYLDSAFIFEKKVNNLYPLVVLYNYAGAYYSRLNNTEKSHEYYYKAINCYEKMNGYEEKIITILYNLSSKYEEKEDLATLKKLTDKIETLAPKADKPLSYMLANMSKAAYYYKEWYIFRNFEDSTNTNLLDSVVLYSKNTIRIYDETKDKDFQATWDNIIANCYTRLALAEGVRSYPDIPDVEKVLYYIEKSESYSVSLDFFARLNNKSMRAICYYHQRKYELAIQESLAGLKDIENYVKNQNPNLSERFNVLVRGFYHNLSVSYKDLGNYQKAYDYMQQENEYIKKISRTAVHRTVKDMEARYDLETKEREILILNEQALYQAKIRYLYAGIIGLLLLVIIIGLRMYMMKKKAVLKDMEIVQLEKEEIEMQVHLKEEQAKRIELEKYEALLEVHFKDMEIEGKELELQELKSNKQILDKQIESYSNKLRQYEQNFDTSHEKNKTSRINSLIAEINLLIEKKSCKEKDKYLKKMKTIEENFITQLEKVSSNTISMMYTKYCICFAINMSAKEVADCFSVELSSVHMIRYRLKKKLKLENNDDLNIYLANMLVGSVHH